MATKPRFSARTVRILRAQRNAPWRVHTSRLLPYAEVIRCTAPGGLVYCPLTLGWARKTGETKRGRCGQTNAAARALGMSRYQAKLVVGATDDMNHPLRAELRQHLGMRT